MPNLKYLYSKKANETYTVNWFDGPQVIENNGYTFKSETLKGIVDITSFTDDTFNETKNYYFKKYLKFNFNGVDSDMFNIEEILKYGLTFSCDGGVLGLNSDKEVSKKNETELESLVNTNDNDDDDDSDKKISCDIPLDPDAEIIISIIYMPVQDGIILENQHLEVDNIKIGGEYLLNVSDEEAQLPNTGDEVILTSSDVYKIFNLEDFILVSNHGNVDIKYRFTQDNNRTYTKWLPLNKENIASTKLNPLRFAQVEYSITNLGNPLMVYDIILVGDFQNVSANYLKTNKYGLKEDCVTDVLSDSSNSNNTCSLNGLDNLGGNGNTKTEFVSNCSSYSDNTANEIDKENQETSGSYWNPYDNKKITDLSNLLGNQVSEIFGWDVDYHLTDPDFNGIDRYIHEYTLKNVVDMKKIKVIVPDNKFPVESIIINQFNLDFFDTFEIHIMKDEFKNKFGITRRPAEDDILYICQANMLYYVKHAQAFKDVMNAATYYKVILEKYEYKSNIRNGLAESKTQIDELTNNTTIEELFGNDIKDTEKQIANKEQMKPTSFDYIRQKISTKVIYEKETLIIDDLIPVMSAYNLSDKSIKGKNAINYKKSDTLIKSDNRSFMFWFKFNNEYDYNSGRISNKILNSYSVPKNTDFNLLNNYDSDNNLGYNIYYKNDVLFFNLNDQIFKIKQQLLTNIWYVGVVNLNQKEQYIDFNIYKRDADINIVMVNEQSYQRELVLETDTQKITDLILDGYKPISNLQSTNSLDLELINSNKTELEPVEFKIDSNLRILGSNIKYTNMRVFSDVIPEVMIKNMIKQNIVKESQHLIIADNAIKKIVATNFYNRNWK